MFEYVGMVVGMEGVVVVYWGSVWGGGVSGYVGWMSYFLYNVLVVEDEMVIVEIVLYVLCSEGYVVCYCLFGNDVLVWLC